MKYANVNGVRKEAEPGLSGICPSCDQPLISKCGEIKIKHWAHKGKRHCDPWWENETEWHRGWKDLFPVEWREVPSKDENGEKHIADIKRPDGFFIEFQNSPISSEEVESRNRFYKNLVWVVNGCRSSLDLEKAQLLSNLRSEERLLDISKINMRISKKWKNAAKHIFIDFSDNNVDGKKRLFYLLSEGKYEFICEVLVEDFVSMAKTKGAMKPFVQKAHAMKDEIIEREVESVRKRTEWEKKYIDPFR